MLLSEHLGHTVLLVAHGGILNVFLCFLFGIPLNVIWTFKLSPASFSEVFIGFDGPTLTILNYGPNISIDDMYFGITQDGISQLSKNTSLDLDFQTIILHEYS